jgi:hypothetical protein
MASAVKVEIICFGDVQISRHLLRFGERALRAKPLWRGVYEDLLMIEDVQFLTEGAHGSGGWPELSPVTVQEKAYRNQEPWILRATESLYRSLTRSGTSHNIREIENTWMRFGSDVPHGHFHQSGTAKMPVRKPIDLTETERKLIVKKVQWFILKGEVAAL